MKKDKNSSLKHARKTISPRSLRPDMAQIVKSPLPDNRDKTISELIAALITAKDKALLAIPSAIGFTQGDLQEIADVCREAINKARMAA